MLGVVYAAYKMCTLHERTMCCCGMICRGAIAWGAWICAVVLLCVEEWYARQVWYLQGEVGAGVASALRQLRRLLSPLQRHSQMITSRRGGWKAAGMGGVEQGPYLWLSRHRCHHGAQKQKQGQECFCSFFVLLQARKTVFRFSTKNINFT